jgi:Asp-tRNA(Asn)/Glu-tRNA(Gln) amidotransferase C subunit
MKWKIKLIKINFNKLSVDNIVKQFTDIMAQLDEVSSYHKEKIEANVYQIDKLNEDNKARESEVKRALAVRNKIESLIKE